MQPLPTEIVMLGVAVVLLLGQLFLQSVSATMEMGGVYKAGPRDERRELQGVFAGRAERAFRNLSETFPVFAALTLARRYGRNGGLGATGAEAWVICDSRSAALFNHFPMRQPGLVRVDVCTGRDANPAFQ